MQGKIVKGIAGFYYVYIENSGIYECKAKGVFRQKNQKPLVGELVEIDILDEQSKLGNITKLLPRKNELIRPAVANIDQAVVIFAITRPDPNLNLLDRFLVMMEQLDIPVHICFNKADLANEEEREVLRAIYETTGYPVHFICAKSGEGMDALKDKLRGKISTVAGPSGVGKSTVINRLQNNIVMETGAISEKIGRGRHTTRHSELIMIEENSFIIDTPGFTSLTVDFIPENELELYFPEFEGLLGQCRFQGCAHIHEPDCRVKECVEKGEISSSRYDSYKNMYTESKDRKRY